VSRAVGHHRSPPPRDRGDQLRVAADKDPILADGLMLVSAVVIAGDRAGADVHALADPGIAEVAEMIRLGALPQLGFFHLDEIADLGRATDHRPRPQVGERPYRRVVFETSLPNHATVLDHHSMTEDACGNPGLGADL